MGKGAEVGGIRPLPKGPQSGGQLAILPWAGWVKVRSGEAGETRLHSPRLDVFVIDAKPTMGQFHP